jgi:hypothetical protein
LLIAGDHVPDIPFVDVVGKENVPLEQMGLIVVNKGVVKFTWLIITLADWPWQPY